MSNDTLDLFEDLPVLDGDDATDGDNVDTDVESTATDSATKSDANEGTEWPIVVEDALPEDALTIADFVKALNQRLVADEMQRLMDSENLPAADAAVSAVSSAIVEYAKVMQLIKAKGNPLPHYIHRTTVTVDGEEKSADKIYVPREVGIEAFINRAPGKRGPSSGTSGAGLRGRANSGTPEEKILRAGKFAAKLEKEAKRLADLQARVDKMTATKEKYTAILNSVNATWDDATAAHEKWLESQEDASAIGDDD